MSLTIVIHESHWPEPIVQEVRSIRFEEVYHMKMRSQGEVLVKTRSLRITHEDGETETMRFWYGLQVYILDSISDRVIA